MLKHILLFSALFLFALQGVQELKDGSRVVISGNKAYIITHSGDRQPAPDGTHVLKDGGFITTRDGVIIGPVAAPGSY